MFPLAIPLITTGVQALFGALGNRKGKAEKANEANVAQQSALAKEMAGFARSQASMANPAMTKAMQYYSNLVSGGRGAMDAALAPERGQIAEAARGAQMGMDAKMAPGPQRDAALAELQRQKFGQMAMLPLQARGNAVDKLGGMGQNLMQNSSNMMGASADVMSGLSRGYQSMADAERQRRQSWSQMGSNAFNILGPTIFEKLGGLFKKKPLPSTGTVGTMPNMPAMKGLWH